MASSRKRSLLAIGARGLRLPPAEWSGFLRAYAALVRMDLALRLRGFGRVAAGIDRIAPTSSAVTVSEIDVPRVNAYVRWIASAARLHVVPAHCLHESLTLHRWLREDGLPSELRIGVRLEEDGLLAHAWVELCGQVVNDLPSNVARYHPLETLDGATATWDAFSPRSRALLWNRT